MIANLINSKKKLHHVKTVIILGQMVPELRHRDVLPAHVSRVAVATNTYGALSVLPETLVVAQLKAVSPASHVSCSVP